MDNLLVLTFIIKLLARTKVFKYIKEKYGRNVLRQYRCYEKLCLRKEKTSCDLNFLLTCKKEKLTPIFARPKISVTIKNKMRKKIGRLIIETEISNKHRNKKETIRRLVESRKALMEGSSYILLQAVTYRIRMKVQDERKKWKTTHNKKLHNLRLENKPKETSSDRALETQRIHNFSSYNLTDIEINMLSYTLDHYIPGKKDNRRLEVEFERFYQEIIPHTNHLEETDKTRLKSRFLTTYYRYSGITKKYGEEMVARKLAKNENIVILRQDKGRGVVIMDRKDYLDKSLEFLNSRQFSKLEYDPTKEFQGIVQRKLLKMKTSLGKKTYDQIYPSASQPGLFFGMAKVHKVPENSVRVEDLPLRPVISNVTYQLSKFLAELLLPLSKSIYTVDSTKDFINRIRGTLIQNDYKMVSFDVKSLFTNVPLDYTIELILNKVYRDKLIQTKLKRKELSDLLGLCTKDLHFTFDNQVYRQVDGVAMGSPLGPIIANIFMVQLEESIVPNLEEDMPLWLRYVDDTFTFIKYTKVEMIKTILDSFHKDIEFTYEIEEENSISFLDVRVIRADGNLITEVFRKKTDTNMYINWDSYSPKSWKIGTLKGLIRRAHIICSKKEGLDKEIKFLRHIFHIINGYPEKVIDSTINTVEVEMGIINGNLNANGINNEEIKKVEFPYMVLPYRGEVGDNIMKEFKKYLVQYLPNSVIPRVNYRGRQVSTFFRVKDKVNKEHMSDLIYRYDCKLGDQECVNISDYIGETKVRYGTRSGEHVTDDTSAIYRHALEYGHSTNHSNFEILATGYNKTVDRKLAEALYIRDLKPNLNKQICTQKLWLFK